MILLNLSPDEIISAIPLKRYPLRENGSTTLISIDGLCSRFSIVLGDCISAKTRCDSSNTMIVPFAVSYTHLTLPTKA